jgi:hypothetical protein
VRQRALDEFAGHVGDLVFVEVQLNGDGGVEELFVGARERRRFFSQSFEKGCVPNSN